MRNVLINIWRKLTRIKILTPFLIFIRYFAGTNFFNTILDFWEIHISHTSYEMTRSFIEKNGDRIKKIEKNLGDKKSLQIYRNIWKYRSSHKRVYLKGIVDHIQYFDKELIHLNDKEIFVDCGAYKGDTIKDFLDTLADKNIFEHIVALEPDPYNFKQLQKNIKKLHDNRITCYNFGSWNKKEMLHFRSNTEEGCMISEDGDAVIQVDSIDNMLYKQAVSFIKMDVEGAELKSLEGAETVIRRNRPKLAISIYHSDNDMIDIPEYIMQNYPFYKIFIRHYTYFYADTVLYAIPE